MNQQLDTSEILTPSGFIILNLGEIATHIEEKYKNCLKPPVEGIYKIGEHLPTIKNDQFYYVKNVNDPAFNKQLTTLADLKEGDYIVNAAGTIILDQHLVSNRNYALSNIPTVPTTGYLICKNVIQYYVSGKNQFTKESNNYVSSIGKLLLNEYNTTDIVYKIIEDNGFSTFHKHLDYFIGRDINHVYFYKHIGICDLVVEKTIDWRAYQWHQNQMVNREY